MTEQENFLLPTVAYLKSGIHIGTKFKTKYMRKFIYKTRPDGLSVLNLKQVDERIRIVGRFLANYEPKDILVVSRRESGAQALTTYAPTARLAETADKLPKVLADILQKHLADL